jgi:hypothetical protein
MSSPRAAHSPGGFEHFRPAQRSFYCPVFPFSMAASKSASPRPLCPVAFMTRGIE